MPIEIELSDLDTFAKNGISEDAIRDTINAYRKEGVSDDEISQKIQNKLSEFRSPSAEQDIPEQGIASEQEQPKEKMGLLPAVGVRASNAFLAGAGSIAAGMLNVPIVRRTVLPLAYAAEKLITKTPDTSVQEIPQAVEQYKRGAKEYGQALEQAKQEYPVASTLTDIGATIASFLLPIGAVGKGVKGAVAGSKLIQSAAKMGKIGALTEKIVPNVARGMAEFGAYESVKKATEGEPGTFSPKGAAIGAVQGIGTGGLIGVAGGVAGEFEEPLIQKAIELGGNPMASRLLGMAATSTVEGATLGVAPAIMQGRLPGYEEFKSGMQFALGARGVSKAAELGATGTRALTEMLPASEKRQMIAARRGTKALEAAEELAGLDTEEALAARQQLAKDASALVKQSESLTKKINKTSDESTLAELNKKLTETNTELNSAYEKLNKEFDAAKKSITTMSQKMGWKLPEEAEQQPSRFDTSAYVDIKKGQRIERVRISGHDSTSPRKGDFIEWDIRKPAKENLKALYDRLNEAEIERAVSKGAVEVKQEEIKKFLKKYPDSTPEQAEVHIRDYKQEQAVRKGRLEETGSTTLDKMLRTYQGGVEWARTQFNLLRPVTRSIEKTEKATGVKVPYAERADFTVSKLNNGGEVEAFLKPIADTAKELGKKSNSLLLDADKIAKLERVVAEERRTGAMTSKSLDALRDLEKFRGSKYAHQFVEAVRNKLQEGLDLLYKSGRLSKEFYEDLKARKDYVPLKAVLEEDSLVANGMKGDVESSLRAYKGDAEAYENSILSSLNLLKSEFRFAEIQKAKKQYIAQAKKIGEAQKVPTKTSEGKMPDFNRDSEIVVWENGAPQVWRVPKEVARVFNPQRMPDRSKLFKRMAAFAGWPMRVFKGATTAASGGFVVSNLPRDYTSAVIMSENGAFIGPTEIREAGADLLSKKPIVNAFKKEQGGQTLVTSYGIPDLAEDNLKNIVNMYEASTTAFKDGTQRNALTRLFTQAVGEYARKLLKIAKGTEKTVLEGLTFAGNLSEETTRLAVFKSSLKRMAKSEAQYKMWIEKGNVPKDVLAKAGNESREVTLNFKRPMAPWVEWTNRYAVPFFKPSILGAMRGFEALTNPAIAPRAWRYLFNLGVLQGIVKGNMADEETIKKYEAINNEIIDKTFTLTDDNGRPYTFPLAQELAPLVNLIGGLTEKVYRSSTGTAREDINREITQSLKDTALNFVPAAGTFAGAGNMIPQPLKVFVEQKINKDTYTGVPIESEAQMKKLPHLRYTSNTSPTLVKVADILSKRGIEVSPLRMQHALKAIGSNTAKESLALTDAIGEKMLWNKLRPKSDVSDNPILRRTIPSLYAPYGQIATDAREIVAETKPAFDYVEKNGEEGLSDTQKKDYNLNANIYTAIEQYWLDVQETIKDRNEALKEIEEAGDFILEKYKNKEISREDAIYEQDNVLKYYADLLDFYNKQELDLMWELVKAANEAKKEYEKAPK